MASDDDHDGDELMPSQLKLTRSQQRGKLVSISDMKEMCGKCDKVLKESENGNPRAVVCDICKTKYHQKCGGLTDELYKLVLKFGKQGTGEIPWHCKICKKYASSMMSEMVDLKRRQDKLEKQVSDIKEQMISIEENQNASPNHGDADSLRKTVREVLEQDKRQMNLVISNLPEITSTSTTRAIVKAVKDLFQSKLDVNANDVERVDLIQTERANLVKVQMKTKKARRTALINAKKLKEDEVYKNVYVKPDLTYEQRQQEATLRQELRDRKEEGEKNLMIVRGKIVVRQPPPSPENM